MTSKHKILAILTLLVLLLPATATQAHNIDKGAFDQPAHVKKLEELLRENWIASLMMMTEQLSTVMMQQTMIIGSFFDAKHQLETQRLLQELTADAHKNYQPGVQMCVIGTNVRSLAASQFKSMHNTRILNTILQDREVLAKNMASDSGIANDFEARAGQFMGVYCDGKENDGNLDVFCSSDAVAKTYPESAKNVSADLDFYRTVWSNNTMDLDFTDQTVTNDERDVIALSKYLFAHKPFSPVPPALWDDFGAERVFKDIRSITAMRSVARYSFAQMVGMRGKGTNSAPYMKNIIKTLGMEDADINAFIGENPSYFAQMEVLTNNLFQSPTFYTNLYDKPANVQRMRVALQALDLMQDRDRYESSLRREMLIAMIVEAKLREYQARVNNTLYNTLAGDGLLSDSNF